MISFNNRETAWLAWLGVFLVSVLMQREVRDALWACVKAFCAPQILRMVALMLMYVGICVVLLAALHIWRWDNLKTTLLWTVTFALVTMLDANSVSEDDTFYRQTIRDTVNATALVLFVAEVKSFSLLVELVLVVPGMVLLGLCLAIVQTRPEVKSARGMVESIAAIVILGLVIAGLIEIWRSPQEIWTWSTLRELCVPILLSLLFLPFIYLLSTYMVLERIFLPLPFTWPDEGIRRYARAKVVFAFAGDLEAMRRWGRNVRGSRPASEQDVDLSIREVLEARQREKSPPDVPPDEGWSPYSAKGFLEAEGLRTDDYHKAYNGLWAASSKMKVLDEELFPNSVSYRVEGSESAATRLRLALNVNNRARDSDAREIFTRMAVAICDRVLAGCVTEKLAKAARAGKVLSMAAANADVRIARDDWKNGKLSGYTLSLSITHHAESGARNDE